MIDVEALTVHYGAIRALDGVSVRVQEGDLVALTGANGAGKSTLLRAIAGIIPWVSGHIRFEGRDLKRLATHEIVRRGLGLVPEGRALFPGLSVHENLAMGAYQFLGPRPIPPGSEMDRVYALFPVLRERRQQLAGTLSGGEQQMLALGRALMGRPRVLLCDEPSTGLAPRLADSILATLRQLRDQGITVLLAEQNAAAALRIADRGYVLENGRIVLGDTAAALLSNPRVAAAYLGSDPAEPGEPTGSMPPDAR